VNGKQRKFCIKKGNNKIKNKITTIYFTLTILSTGKYKTTVNPYNEIRNNS
jgi:hypothetical protein